MELVWEKIRGEFFLYKKLCTIDYAHFCLAGGDINAKIKWGSISLF